MAVEVNELLSAGRCLRCYDETGLLRKQAAILCLILGGNCDPEALLRSAKCFNCGSARQIELAITQLLCELLNEGPCDVADVANDTPLLNYASWKDLYIIQTQLLCEFWGGDCDDIADIEMLFCCLSDKRSIRLVILQLICEIIENPPISGQVNAGEDQDICIGSGPVMLFGSANGTTGWLWTTSGDGTFSDATILNSHYTPGAGDIALGTVTLTLTSSSPPSSDSMTVTLFEAATVSVGPDLTTEGIQQVQLNAVIGGSATGGTWTTSGTGTFDNANALDAIYTPSDAEAIAGGNVTLTFTTNDPTGVCPPVSDSLTLTITAVCDITAPLIYYMMDEPDQDIYRHDSGPLGYHIQKFPVVASDIGEVVGKIGPRAVSIVNAVASSRLEYNDQVALDVGGPSIDTISLGFQDTNPPDPADFEFSIAFWFKLGTVYGVGEAGTQTFFARRGNLGAAGPGYSRFQCEYARAVGFHHFLFRYWNQDEFSIIDIPYSIDGGAGRLSDVVADTYYFAVIRRRKSDDLAHFWIGDVASMNLSNQSVFTLVHPRYSVTERVPLLFGAVWQTTPPMLNPISDGSVIDEWAFFQMYPLTDAEIECMFNDGVGKRLIGLEHWLPEVTITTDGATTFPIEVTMSVDGHPDAEIRYTTDGSLPTSTSTLYTAPFDVTETLVVRALAFETGFQPSVAALEFLVAPPANITDLQLFLAAHLDDNIYNDNDAVNVWPDHSGNDNDFEQSVAASQPVFKTSVVNGLDVIRWDGTNDNLVGPAVMTGATEGEIFIVVKVDNDPPGAGAQTGLWDFSASDFATHYPLNGTGQVFDAWGTTVRKTTINPATSLAAFHVYNVVSAAGEWTSRWNGGGVDTFTTAVNTVTFRTDPKLGMSLTGAFFLDGDIAEVIVYSRELTGGERDAIEAYLGAKYNITMT